MAARLGTRRLLSTARPHSACQRSLPEPLTVTFSARHTAEIVYADGRARTVDTRSLRQREDAREWMRARAALDCTASEFACAAWDASPFRSRAALVAEKAARRPSRHVDTPATRFGAASEPLAVADYVRATGNAVEATGLWTDDAARLGASPDGVVVDASTGERGLLEVKCSFHRRRDRGLPPLDAAPRGFLAQIQGQLAIAELDWCDLALWIPKNAPDAPHLRVLRVRRDAAYWADLRPRLLDFAAEVAARRLEENL